MLRVVKNYSNYSLIGPTNTYSWSSGEVVKMVKPQPTFDPSGSCDTACRSCKGGLASQLQLAIAVGGSDSLGKKYQGIDLYISWWFQPIWKNISQIRSSTQVGVNIKNVWNHHQIYKACLLIGFRASPTPSTFHSSPCNLQKGRIDWSVHSFHLFHLGKESFLHLFRDFSGRILSALLSMFFSSKHLKSIEQRRNKSYVLLSIVLVVNWGSL